MTGCPRRAGPGPGLYGVLVTFRRPDWLARTLDRLAEQDRPLDRLVVVDNGPTEETEALVAGVPVRRPARRLPGHAGEPRLHRRGGDGDAPRAAGSPGPGLDRRPGRRRPAAVARGARRARAVRQRHGGIRSLDRLRRDRRGPVRLAPRPDQAGSRPRASGRSPRGLHRREPASVLSRGGGAQRRAVPRPPVLRAVGDRVRAAPPDGPATPCTGRRSCGWPTGPGPGGSA